jgi:hypothetical protein
MDGGPVKDGDMDSRGQPPLPPEKQTHINTQNTFSNPQNSVALSQNPAALPRISKTNQEILCHRKDFNR